MNKSDGMNHGEFLGLLLLLGFLYQELAPGPDL